MASLSDQIDRFTRNTRNIKSAAAQTANPPTTFTRAVLTTHLGDLIRDIDPSELGLFTLVQPFQNNDRPDPQVKRTEFPGATPLRRRHARPEAKQEIEPEVYAQAALKYIDQYEPVRPMPRAYDQIVNVLNKLNAVRESIEALNVTLKQTVAAVEGPPIKARVEQEERRIQELQARIQELPKKKESASKPQRSGMTRPKPQTAAPPVKVQRKTSTSPQEEKFWSTPGEPSRTLRFAENLLDEEVSLGDVSMASFGSPTVAPTELRRGKMFAEMNSMDSFVDEPTIIQRLVPEEDSPVVKPLPEKDTVTQTTPASPPTEEIQETSPEIPATPTSEVSSKRSPSIKLENKAASNTPKARHHRVKVNIELEKIAAKFWSTMGDAFTLPHGTTSPLPVNETITYLQQLSIQTPQLDSPLPSSASSASIEGVSPPSEKQVFTAYLLTMLLSAPPHYSMSLNQVKENLVQKAKSNGISVTGRGTTGVLYGCIAKRLLKFDRGGREQVVKFDI